VDDEIKHRHTSLYPICDKILRLLCEADVKAIFFFVGETASANPELVRKIVASGHQIGSHSMRHKLHSEMDDEEFETDLRESLEVLEEICGFPIEHYRAPGFSLTAKFLHRYQLLEKHGIKFDFSIFLNGGSHGGINESDLPKKSQLDNFFDIGGVKAYPFLKSKILGLPISLLGGGYFRLFPVTWAIASARSSKYCVTYFHPRDFDPDQPVIENLGLVRRFRSYVGLRSSFKKLEELISGVSWSDPRMIQ
jgi:polysaccharide deacetylase family protein (PEP-CTERM system associated)